MGLEFYFSNAVTQEYKLTGFIDANGNYHNTQFYDAFTKGGVFMLDEIDASTPEVLVILNAAIANKYFDFPTGRVSAHEDFRIVAAGNTYGTGADIEYTGRYQLDAASLDRFAIIEIDYSQAIENAIAGGNAELVAFIRDFREQVKKAGIKFIVSYRATERLKKLEDVFSKAEAIKIALIRGMDKEDALMVASNLTNKTSYSDALQEAVLNG
jgi:MoxR-like ATPase